MIRKPKSTKEENKLARDAQAPRRSMSDEPPVNVAFELLRKKMNESRYADEPQAEWRKAASLVGEPFYIHRAFKMAKGEFGPQVGFECSEDPAGERFLVSLAANDERTAMYDAIVSIKKTNGRRAYIGPLTIRLCEPSNPAFKPYMAFAEYEGEFASDFEEDTETKKPAKKAAKKPAKKGDVPF